jgi:hypothetical protein
MLWRFLQDCAAPSCCKNFAFLQGTGLWPTLCICIHRSTLPLRKLSVAGSRGYCEGGVCSHHCPSPDPRSKDLPILIQREPTRRPPSEAYPIEVQYKKDFLLTLGSGLSKSFWQFPHKVTGQKATPSSTSIFKGKIKGCTARGQCLLEPGKFAKCNLASCLHRSLVL